MMNQIICVVIGSAITFLGVLLGAYISFRTKAGKTNLMGEGKITILSRDDAELIRMENEAQVIKAKALIQSDEVEKEPIDEEGNVINLGEDEG